MGRGLLSMLRMCAQMEALTHQLSLARKRQLQLQFRVSISGAPLGRRGVHRLRRPPFTGQGRHVEASPVKASMPGLTCRWSLQVGELFCWGNLFCRGLGLTGEAPAKPAGEASPYHPSPLIVGLLNAFAVQKAVLQLPGVLHPNSRPISACL